MSEQDSEHIEDKQDFIQFMRSLNKDLIQNPDTWENRDLGSFLSAIENFLIESTEKSLVVVDFTPSWDLFATLLYAGKNYE